MKQYIKDGKIYNLPIIIKNDDGTTTYTNDETRIFAAGYEEYVYVPPKKSLEQLINESNEVINRQTDEKILNDFVWNENEFYLTSENQMNFANMYIAKDYLTYPQLVKTKTGFIELQSAEEVTAFYLAGINFVKTCLQDGWVAKATAEAEIRENYVIENQSESSVSEEESENLEEPESENLEEPESEEESENLEEPESEEESENLEEPLEPTEEN